MKRMKISKVKILSLQSRKQKKNIYHWKIDFDMFMLLCHDRKKFSSIFESIFIATCSLTCYLKIDKCNCNVARTGSNHYLKKVHVLFVSINGSHKTKDITIITLAINVQHWKVCSNFNAYSNLLHELCKNLCVLFSRSQYRNYMRHNSY